MAKVPRAFDKALTEGLAGIQRQLQQVQSSFTDIQQALKKGSASQLNDLLPALLQLQTAGAALAASIESVLRFAGSSYQWAGSLSSTSASEAAVAATTHEVELEEPEPAAATEGEAEPVAAAAPPPVAEAPPAPPGPHRLTDQEIEKLPDDLRDLHKKAKRFAKVTVQEFMMYKKDEVLKGRDARDIYERLRDEIDKSKALYDRRFGKIAEHNIDYFYDEMVRVLANNDPNVLGKYPYPVPARG